jgi:hypothetical protein
VGQPSGRGRTHHAAWRLLPSVREALDRRGQADRTHEVIRAAISSWRERVRGSGAVESLTGEAERWLADLPADGLELPNVVYEVAGRSRSGIAGSPARARVRSSSGR